MTYPLPVRHLGLLLLLVSSLLLVTSCTAPAASPAAAEPTAPAATAAPSPTPAPPDPPAPDLKLPTIDGREIRLSELRGNVVLLNFWATWCPYCRQERATLQQAYDTYKGQGFIILSVTTENDLEALRAYADEQGLTFPILSDASGAVTMTYGVRGIPASYFITREGNVHAKRVGPLDMETIADYMAKLQ